MEYALQCLRYAEKNRREKPNVSTVPHHECGTDYGEAGQVITNAMGHLDEALSVGQRMRAVYALTALVQGVAGLSAYMLAAGYAGGPPAPAPSTEPEPLRDAYGRPYPSMAAALDRATTENSSG